MSSSLVACALCGDKPLLRIGGVFVRHSDRSCRIPYEWQHQAIPILAWNLFMGAIDANREEAVSGAVALARQTHSPCSIDKAVQEAVARHTQAEGERCTIFGGGVTCISTDTSRDSWCSACTKRWEVAP